MYCITCDNKKYPLCTDCSKNPYFVEKARRELAGQNDTKNLKLLYSKALPEIKDNNSKHFWNKKFSDPVFFNDESTVTRERIKIAASFIPSKSGKILDIGAGVGLIEEYLLANGPRHDFHGIDVSDISVKLLKKRFKGDFRVGSVYDLPYKDNSFDTVLALEVLEHIPPSKIFRVLEKIKKILKPDGIFICSVPLNERIWGLSVNESSHLREYSVKLLEKELVISGLTPRHKKTIYAFGENYHIKSLIARNMLMSRWDVNDLIMSAGKK